MQAKFDRDPVRGVSFRTPTAEDVEFVAANMRFNDRREVKRWLGREPREELLSSVAGSEVCWAGVFADGKVGAIFGGAWLNLIEGEAVIWALTTTEIDTHRREFLAASRAGLDMVCRAMPGVQSFMNYVDGEYTGAVRWLEWLGAWRSVKSVTGRCGGVFVPMAVENPHCKEA